MIVTVTLNPSLDYIQFVPSFAAGKLNRCEKELIRPGGKGINVSLMLREFGVDSTAAGFAAGFTGEELVRVLQKQGIRCAFVPVEGMTRINVKVMAQEETEINGCGPAIYEKDICALYKKLSGLSEGDFLILSGSVPNTLPTDLYAKIMQKFGKNGVRFVVDTSGEALGLAVEQKPFLVKPNHQELSELLHVEIKTVQQAADAAKVLLKKGAQNVLCSMGEAGAVLASEDGNTLFCRPPKGELVNSVAAGDSMLAGFLAGYLQTGKTETALRTAVAAGSATAYSAWLAGREFVQQLLDKIPETERL